MKQSENVLYSQLLYKTEDASPSPMNFSHVLSVSNCRTLSRSNEQPLISFQQTSSMYRLGLGRIKLLKVSFQNHCQDIVSMPHQGNHHSSIITRGRRGPTFKISTDHSCLTDCSSSSARETQRQQHFCLVQRIPPGDFYYRIHFDSLVSSRSCPLEYLVWVRIVVFTKPNPKLLLSFVDTGLV